MISQPQHCQICDCLDEAVVTEKLIDYYSLSHLSPVKPRRTIKLQHMYKEGHGCDKMIHELSTSTYFFYRKSKRSYL